MRVSKRKKQNNNHRNETDGFYLSVFWRSLVANVWQRDKCLCQECLRDNRLTQLQKPSPTPHGRGYVDHIQPRTQGGSDTLDNLELLCKPCHDSKSAKERNISVSGERLIHLVGNIASGKSTALKALGFPSMEINNIYQGKFDTLVLESSGISRDARKIIKNFKKVLTVKFECTKDDFLKRIEERERTGYVYPTKRRSPKEFYVVLGRRIDRLPCDLLVNSSVESEKEIVKRILNFRF